MLSQFQLSGKVAIVTGASKGIGEAIARTLAQAGAKVVVSSRNQEAVEAVAAQYRAEGWEALGLAANVGKEPEVTQLVSQTVAHFGGLDIVVNNAGTNLVYHQPLIETDMGAFDKMMDINLKGPLWLARAAYPHLKKSQSGAIINIASIEGLEPSEGLGVYSLTKAALIMMTKVLAREMGADHIRVNAICPGYIPTKLTESVFGQPEEKARILARQTIPYEAKPEDIAGLALLLASEAGAFFSGSIITADGGYTV
ncbi:MAG: SDR family oxidoreductase [Microscillaceae bacterium]